MCTCAGAEYNMRLAWMGLQLHVAKVQYQRLWLHMMRAYYRLQLHVAEVHYQRLWLHMIRATYRTALLRNAYL